MKKLIKKGQTGLKTSYNVLPTNISKTPIGQFQYGVTGLGTMDDYHKRNGKKSLPTEPIRYHPTDNEMASNNRTIQIGN